MSADGRSASTTIRARTGQNRSWPDIEKAGGKAIAVGADVSTEDGAVHLFETATKELGPVTGLFNNAGTILPAGRLVDCTAEDLERLWRINVTSQFLCAREAVKRMSTASGGKGGAIVNMSSVHARIGAPGMFVSYAASKGAIDSFTHGLALEVVEEGIRVNAVRPGLINTEIHALGGDPDRPKRFGNTVPIGREGSPEEVAEAGALAALGPGVLRGQHPGRAWEAAADGPSTSRTRSY